MNGKDEDAAPERQEASTGDSPPRNTTQPLELASTLSSNTSLGRHVRRASSIAGQRAQKAQAESRRAASALVQVRLPIHPVIHIHCI
jgi:hypothetical protein